MGGEHVIRVKDKNVVFKFMNKLPSKFQIAKYFAIFVGILVFAYVFYVTKQYNNVAALTTAAVLLFCYLLCDLIVTSGIKVKFLKLTKRNKPKHENVNENENESLKKEIKALSDRNEDLTRQLEWLRKDKHEDLREDLVSEIKSQCGRKKESLSRKLEDVKYWVVKNNVCVKKLDIITDKLEGRNKYDRIRDRSPSDYSDYSDHNARSYYR